MQINCIKNIKLQSGFPANENFYEKMRKFSFVIRKLFRGNEFFRNIFAFFFAKFSHFLFRENFTFHNKTDKSEILRANELRKMRNFSRNDLLFSLETLVTINFQQQLYIVICSFLVFDAYLF